MIINKYLYPILGQYEAKSPSPCLIKPTKERAIPEFSDIALSFVGLYWVF